MSIYRDAAWRAAMKDVIRRYNLPEFDQNALGAKFSTSQGQGGQERGNSSGKSFAAQGNGIAGFKAKSL